MKPRNKASLGEAGLFRSLLPGAHTLSPTVLEPDSLLVFILRRFHLVCQRAFGKGGEGSPRVSKGSRAEESL